MKHSLGKIILLFLCSFILHAEDFSYAIVPSKQEAYLHEPLLLTVDLNQTNPDVILLFQFAVNQSKNYEVKPLFIQHDDTPHHTKHHALYQLYPPAYR